MNELNAEKELDSVFKPLVKHAYEGCPPTYFVLVSHNELDWLIASLMHICELDSDKEHREALKGEIKWRSRNWLNERYNSAGYVNHEIVARAHVVDLTKAEADLASADPTTPLSSK